ncbi:hypothetical protein FRC01_003153 [Tulasnella sp. 417]|nr:hypothetical protein FRC01_003153 [Tulasnella sp. 417]
MDSNILQSTLNDLSHLVVPPSQLAFEDDAEIGCGGYGEVYLAHLTKSSETPPQKVAVKQLRIVQSKEVRRRIAIRFARELKVWAAAKHPNILELVGFYLSENYGCAQLISAYIAHGNVKDYIKTCNPRLEIRLNLVKGLTSGINYLHTCDPPICHGDLKPSNVLVNDNIEALLCDFGLATFIDESGASSGLTTSKSVKGSTRYMSPELHLENEVKHTLGSDMWAWACTVLEVLTDREPYHTAKGDVRVRMLLVTGEPPGSVDMLDNLSSDGDATCHRTLDVLKCTIPGCWVSDVAKRPPSSEITTQLFFQRDAKTSDAGSARGQPLLIEPMDEARLVPNEGSLSMPGRDGAERVDYRAFADPAPDPGSGSMDIWPDLTSLAQSGDFGSQHGDAWNLQYVPANLDISRRPTEIQHTTGSDAQAPLSRSNRPAVPRLSMDELKDLYNGPASPDPQVSSSRLIGTRARDFR